MLKQCSPAIPFKTYVKLWNNWQTQWRMSTIRLARNYFSIGAKKPKAYPNHLSPHISLKIREGKRAVYPSQLTTSYDLIRLKARWYIYRIHVYIYVGFSLCKGSHLFFKVQAHFYSACVIKKCALTKPASKINRGQEEFPYMKSIKTLNTECSLYG